MKKTDITYEDKLDELRLDISNPNNKGITFILVEGDSDIRLFRKLFNLKESKVESVPGGNLKLEQCVAELIKIYSLVIGVRDSDFIQLSPIPYENLNMFLTDYHDIEMSLVYHDNIFSSFLFEYSNIPEVNHSKIREYIIDMIEIISFIKWLNAVENLELKFDCGFIDLISFEKKQFDFDQYISRVLAKSPNSKLKNIEIIKNKIADLIKANPPRFQLCNGHDFIKAFSSFINEQGKVKNLGSEYVSSVFRMLFSTDDFAKTDLYKNTKSWADNNNCKIHL